MILYALMLLSLLLTEAFVIVLLATEPNSATMRIKYLYGRNMAPYLPLFS